MKLLECSPYLRFAYRVMIRYCQPRLAGDCRLFYVTDGKGEVLVRGERRAFQPGTIMLFQPGTEYGFDSDGEFSVISVNFDYTCERSDLTEPIAVCYKDRETVIGCGCGMPGAPESEEASLPPYRILTFEDCPVLNEPVVCHANSRVKELLEQIIEEEAGARPYHRERSSALMKDCLVQIVRVASSDVTSKNDSALATVMEYIHCHYAEEIKNEQLAALVNYHPYYLNKLFLTANGVTLHRYLVNYRLAHAEQLLLSSKMSVAEVAAAVGFSMPLSFTSSFRKKNGMSPTEFRKKFGSVL